MLRLRFELKYVLRKHNKKSAKIELILKIVNEFVGNMSNIHSCSCLKNVLRLQHS